ncbi:hypothetical protein [Mycobacterium gordonae]|nr:hypothetical protein [Mycobacterium gordonae]
MGHQVTAVDESADMLSHVRRRGRYTPASRSCGCRSGSTPW